MDQRWPDCACSSRVPPYHGADAVVGVERLWSVGGPSIPPCDHSAPRSGFSPSPGYTCLPAGESSGVLGPRSRMSWLPIWISAGKRTHGWRGFSRRWVIMFGALVRDPEVATFESSLGAGGRSGGGVPPAVGFVLEFLHHCYGPDVGRLYYGPDLGSTVFSERDGS